VPSPFVAAVPDVMTMTGEELGIVSGKGAFFIVCSW
jgi:hypothetical protein